MITKSKKQITQIRLALIIIIFISSSIAFARTYTSPNYTLKNARIIISGGKAVSSIYSLNDVRIGNAFGEKAESTNYFLDATNIKKKAPVLPPNPPTINSVTTPTNVSVQTLTGTKESGTSIYINGYQVVAQDNTAIWSCDYALNEGENYLVITARNKYGMESASIMASIFLDASPPTTPLVTDDGAYTSARTQLHASWSSEDPQTGIVEYQYTVGTTSGGTDVVGWISLGTQTEVTHSGLTLIQGQTYYISVKAKNAAGSWSEVGSSDGITLNQTIPSIIEIQPPDGSTGYVGDNINFSVNAQDQDGDSLLYQFSLDGQVICPWQGSPNFNWSTAGVSLGVHTITVEVNDNYGGVVSQDIELCLFRKPPALPAL